MSILEYRDLSKPNPQWDEIGIYGGYRWIKFMQDESIWISRRWEPYMAIYTEAMYSGKVPACGLGCMHEFKDMLADNGILLGHNPTYLGDGLPEKSQTGLFSPGRKYTQDVMRINTEVYSDENRIKRLLRSQTETFIIGNIPMMGELIANRYVHNPVSSFRGYLGKVQYMEESDIMALTDRRLVFVDKSKLNLKGDVRNWANVIAI